MEAERGQGSSDIRGRRWRFASVEFDERGHSLVVDGRLVPIEAKPRALLTVLLERAAEVVTKDELLDRVWPGVVVVEASLPTAMLKLRRALGDDSIIETIPRIGYRLAVPVEELSSGLGRSAALEASSAGKMQESIRGLPTRRLVAGAVALAVLLVAGSWFTAKWLNAPAFSQDDMRDALRELDVDQIHELVRLGWNPDAPIDSDGNASLHVIVEICEWNPEHDPQRLVVAARALLDGDARLDRRNVWGDTPYSIAKAPRFCGPDHPVTKMMHALCYNGYLPAGDRCLATYELAKRARERE